MSQQINLILDDLQPRREWLGLALAVGVAVAGCLVLGLWATLENLSASQTESRVKIVQAESDRLQKAVLEMGQALSTRKEDPALIAAVDAERASLDMKVLALRLVEEGGAGSGAGFSTLMGGFARQLMEGVWLTGFDFVDQQIEIRGRLRDYSLLPLYIRKLNSEEVYRSYRFAALDMKGIEPSADKTETTSPAAKAPAASAQPYTEFLLRSSDKPLATLELKPGSSAATAPPESTATPAVVSGEQYKALLQTLQKTLEPKP